MFHLLAYRGRSLLISLLHFDHHYHTYNLGSTPSSYDLSHSPLCMLSLGGRSYLLMDTLFSTSLSSWCPCSLFYSLLESFLLTHHDLEFEPHFLFFVIFLAIPRRIPHFISCDFHFYQHTFARWALVSSFHRHHLSGLSFAFTWCFTLSWRNHWDEWSY